MTIQGCLSRYQQGRSIEHHFNFNIFTIFQAYDSVCREGLYSKLESVGFGGKTLKLIKSLYCNDSLKFLINGKFSDTLWITRGVKQGIFDVKIITFFEKVIISRL